MTFSLQETLEFGQGFFLCQVGEWVVWKNAESVEVVSLHETQNKHELKFEAQHVFVPVEKKVC